jgi:hypothetical protein
MALGTNQETGNEYRQGQDRVRQGGKRPVPGRPKPFRGLRKWLDGWRVTAHKNRKNCCEPYQVVAYEFEPFAEGEDEITICTWADSERRGWKRLRSPAEAKQDLKKVLSARYL